MKTLEEAIPVIIERVAQTEFHQYMGGSNSYKEPLEDIVYVLSIVYGESRTKLEGRLNRAINLRFEGIRKEELEKTKRWQAERNK